jgi:hypothetical protein
MTRKIVLTKEQIKIITENYGLMTDGELAKMVKITVHTLNKNVKSLNIIPNESKRIFEDFDDGNGFFDIEKYKKTVF